MTLKKNVLQWLKVKKWTLMKVIARIHAFLSLESCKTCLCYKTVQRLLKNKCNLPPPSLSLEQIYGILLFKVLSASVEISLVTQEDGGFCILLGAWKGCSIMT